MCLQKRIPGESRWKTTKKEDPSFLAFSYLPFALQGDFFTRGPLFVFLICIILSIGMLEIITFRSYIK